MAEADLWNTLRDGMAGRWHCQRHEDKYSTGIPDVSFGIGRVSDGWIELKYLDKLPRDLRVRPFDFALDHLTPEQRNWMDLRSKFGTGRVFLMLQAGDAYYLWHWPKLSEMLGRVPFNKIDQIAIGVWQRKIPFDDLKLCLASMKRAERRFTLNDPQPKD